MSYYSWKNLSFLHILQLLWHGIKRTQFNNRLLVNPASHVSVSSGLQIFVRSSSIKPTKIRMQRLTRENKQLQNWLINFLKMLGKYIFFKQLFKNTAFINICYPRYIKKIKNLLQKSPC